MRKGGSDVIVGSGGYTYEVIEDWARLPAGWSFGDVAGVAVDSRDRVYVFNRGTHPMVVFDREGNLLDSWGEAVFKAPHHVRIGPDGMLYCVDFDDHTVRKTTPDGEVLLTLGTSGKPSDTGAVGRDFRTINRASGPFNQPTDVAFGPSGELYVSDGYGNSRIHKFAADGELLESWGEPGEGARQFRLPHSLCVEKEKLYVADRENSRIQVLTLEGEFITEWRNVNRPTCVLAVGEMLYVTELGFLSGLFRGMTVPGERDPLPWLTLRSFKGEVAARFGGEERCAPGNFFAPHTVCVDSRGSVYVGEVTMAVGAPRNCHALQKFVKKSA